MAHTTEWASPAGSGRRVALWREPLSPFPFIRLKEHGTMQTALAPRGDSRTYLTHFVGRGLEDERYVVQRYRSRANGDIVPVDADGVPPKGRRRARPRIVSLREVEKLRPARDEIIIATGVKLRNCGCQYWGWLAVGLFVERRQKG